MNFGDENSLDLDRPCPSPPPKSSSQGYRNTDAADGHNRYFEHGWHSEATSDKTWQERFARTMGQLANLTMGLMILPVARNGVWQKVQRTKSYLMTQP